MHSGVVLCTCNGTLPVDGRVVGKALGLRAPPAVFARLPRDEIQEFMALAARERFDRVLVGCCGPPELFTEAMAAAGAEATPVTVLNLREHCYWPHADAAGANAKASRLLRVALRGVDGSPEGIEHSVHVGSRVLIATDSPRGLELARRVAEFATPTLLLDERSDAFDAMPLHPLPWKASWGRLGEIRGRLGDFQVTVERTQAIDLETCIACMKCVPVCHTAAISTALRLRPELCDRCGDCLQACEKVHAIRIPREQRDVIRADQVVDLRGAAAEVAAGAAARPTRTGHHVLTDPSPAELEAAAWRIYGITGDFRKAEHVRYDPGTCAGGGASKTGCGICIEVCPYEAIDRQGLRVAVDQLTCEGCGACVGACPTSSLRFTDPSDRQLFARVAALLEPLAGGAADRPVVCFHCPEKGRAALDLAGRARLPYPASVLPVAVPCLRYVSEADVLGAFRLGAAGVALLGCDACPHGDRRALTARLDACRAILDAFGAGGERIGLVTVDGAPADAIARLDRFAAGLGPPVLRWTGPLATTEHRAVIADTIGALGAAAGRDPGRLPAGPGVAFAYPDVEAAGCTLCRSCVNVCPTHAFRLVEQTGALELKHVACVACGLCAAVCPEDVITLRPELPLARASLDYVPVVRDEQIACAKCGKPYINRRALEAVEAKVRSLPALGDVFAGNRRNLLRLCPNCRAVTAMFEIQQGWEP